MVQKINPHPAQGCNRSPFPAPYYVLQNLQILGVFRPFLQRSTRIILPYPKFSMGLPFWPGTFWDRQRSQKHLDLFLKFIYYEKAKKLCKISTVDLFYVVLSSQIYGGDFAKLCGLLRMHNEISHDLAHFEPKIMPLHALIAFLAFLIVAFKWYRFSSCKFYKTGHLSNCWHLLFRCQYTTVYIMGKNVSR